MSRVWLFVAVFMGMFIALLDLTIVNVALPKMETALHTDVAGAQWIVDAFSVCLAALLLSGGALGDRYGRKRLYLLGIGLFVAGSTACAAAPSLWVLVCGRALQGGAAALIVPGTFSLIGQAAPDPAKRARIMGYGGMCAALAVMAGPVLGGLLVDAFGWPSIFLVNLPLGLIVIVAGALSIPESKDPEHTSLDPVGQLLAIVLLGTLAYAVIGTRDHGWLSPVTLGLIAMALVCAILLVWVELHRETPMLPIKLFADRRFTAVNCTSLALGFGANGTFFTLGLYLQQVRGKSALDAGLWLLPMTVALAPMSVLAGRMAAKYGPRRPMLIGYVCTGAALLGLMTLRPHSDFWLIAVLFVLSGIGQGLAITPATVAALAIVPRERSGLASATVNTARQIGTAFGIALLGMLIVQRVNGTSPAEFPDAFVSGMRVGLLVAGLTVLLAAVLLKALWRKAPTPEPASQEQKPQPTPSA